MTKIIKLESKNNTHTYREEGAQWRRKKYRALKKK